MGGCVVQRQTVKLENTHVHTSYLSGMPPKKKRLSWSAQITSAFVFSESEALLLVKQLEQQIGGYFYAAIPVARAVNSDLVALDRRRKPIKGYKTRKAFLADETISDGCNNATGRLF